MIRLFAVLIVFGAAAYPFGSSRADTVLEPVDGKGAVLVVRATPDTVLLCVRAKSGKKLNGEYGVATTWPDSDSSLWRQSSPLVIMTGTETMPSPVVVRLDRNSGRKPEPLSVEVGICVEGGCDIATFKVPVPAVSRYQATQPFCVR